MNVVALDVVALGNFGSSKMLLWVGPFRAIVDGVALDRIDAMGIGAVDEHRIGLMDVL